MLVDFTALLCYQILKLIKSQNCGHKKLRFFSSKESTKNICPTLIVLTSEHDSRFSHLLKPLPWFQLYSAGSFIDYIQIKVFAWNFSPRDTIKIHHSFRTKLLAKPASLNVTKRFAQTKVFSFAHHANTSFRRSFWVIIFRILV